MPKINVLNNKLLFQFQCPGCKIPHDISLSKWQWNQNLDFPTISPSINIEIEYSDPSRPSKICHSFVNNGKIKFLPDCTHFLTSQEVELPEL
jgi:Family of unknown function (DUF6527)